MDQSYTIKSIAAVVFVQLFAILVECSLSFDPFMDSKLFSIKWQGPLDLKREEVALLGERHVMITTNHQEQYRCILPEILQLSENEASTYTGPSVAELLHPLFQQTHCSYRIESFWTYELCHGKHLKQYHETKEQGLAPKVQEYFLGFGNHHNLKDTESAPPEDKTDILFRVVDGVELPFYEVIMGDGSKCDLTGQPRKTHVLYVCQPEGWGEVYELKESSTCEYEVIVLSSYLCSHPKYRPKSTPVNEIKCHTMFGSPMKPLELSQSEIETRYLQDASLGYTNQVAPTAVSGAKNKPKYFLKAMKEEAEEPKPQQQTGAKLGVLTDKQTLKDFLTGGQCLIGGTGWWKHELCFGSFVKQFHGDKSRAVNIYLGYWNKEKHVLWLRDNPLKRPRPVETRKYVSLYYSNGDACDLTGKPRDCEVRIKCLENIKNPHAIVLSLTEPESCQYVLTVESALFCPILKNADDNGLFEQIDL
jgi:endoplasmic reticulum lectin 1